MTVTVTVTVNYNAVWCKDVILLSATVICNVCHYENNPL